MKSRKSALASKLNQLVFCAVVAVFSSAAHAVKLENISFSSQTGGKFEIRMDFDSAPPEPEGYTIERPARIALDLPGVSSRLDKKKHRLEYGNASSVVVVESAGRTRAIINLVELTQYSTRIENNSLYVVVGDDSVQDYLLQGRSEVAAAVSSGSVSPAARFSQRVAVSNIDFRRGEDGEGMLIVDLSDDQVDVDVSVEGGNIKAEFINVALPDSLRRKYDVLDFATPVESVDAVSSERGAQFTLRASGEYDYLAYQTDNKYVLSVKPLTEDEIKEKKRQFSYIGDNLSLNFQDIPVRAVLQLIADFTDLNLVASDTVEGKITLRLQNVPWDQALDLVLKTKGLDKRQVGDVLMVAPANEIAERERQEVENNKQREELAPLQTEFIKVRYADASDIFQLFVGGAEGGGQAGGRGGGGSGQGEGLGNQTTQSILSTRGSVVVDERTNSLLVTETAEKLEEFRRLIRLIDVPIPQVMIEARIVRANTDFEEKLGVQWGGGGFSSNGNVRAGGSMSTLNSISTDLDNSNAVEIGFPAALAVDLGVTDQGSSSFAIGYADAGILINMELSALESGGHGEVVSQPKVITGDKQTAIISSGVKIPYQTRTEEGGGAGGGGGGANTATITLEEAVLKLEVTPKITPDDHIIMDLIITQDALAGVASNDQPLIDTTQLETQVLVGNGETVVLGGIFQTEDIVSETKTPFLGDIPYVGALFKRKSNRTSKTETLIFITPSIIADSVVK